MNEPTTIPWEQTAAAWDAASAGYAERIAPRNAPFAEHLLQVLAPPSGARLLDVACGTGIVALRAARAGCAVTAIDFSEQMLRHLSTPAREAELTLDVRCMDGERLHFPDASFDCAVSLFGVQLFADRQAGFREMRRVLAPGGRAAIGAWLGPDRVELLTPLMRALQAVPGAAPPSPRPPLLFSLSDRDAFADELAAAGFRDVTFHEFDHPFTFRDADDYWRLLESAAPTPMESIARLPEQVRRAVRAALDRDLDDSFGTGPLLLAAAAHVAVARV